MNPANLDTAFVLRGDRRNHCDEVEGLMENFSDPLHVQPLTDADVEFIRRAYGMTVGSGRATDKQILALFNVYGIADKAVKYFRNQASKTELIG